MALSHIPAPQLTLFLSCLSLAFSNKAIWKLPEREMLEGESWMAGRVMGVWWEQGTQGGSVKHFVIFLLRRQEPYAFLASKLLWAVELDSQIQLCSGVNMVAETVLPWGKVHMLPGNQHLWSPLVWVHQASQLENVYIHPPSTFWCSYDTPGQGLRTKYPEMWGMSLPSKNTA
jgi:hypothetical protein